MTMTIEFVGGPMDGKLGEVPLPMREYCRCRMPCTVGEEQARDARYKASSEEPRMGQPWPFLFEDEEYVLS